MDKKQSWPERTDEESNNTGYMQYLDTGPSLENLDKPDGFDEKLDESVKRIRKSGLWDYYYSEKQATLFRELNRIEPPLVSGYRFGGDGKAYAQHHKNLKWLF